METSNCPECGAEPTEEDKLYSQLSHLGYVHTDERFECSECENTWIIGKPEGQTESEDWVCGSCGGDLIPHFLYVNPATQHFRVRPKCQDCYHLPDERIEIESKFNGDNIRGFIGHHTTTGDRDDAEDSPI